MSVQGRESASSSRCRRVQGRTTAQPSSLAAACAGRRLQALTVQTLEPAQQQQRAAPVPLRVPARVCRSRATWLWTCPAVEVMAGWSCDGGDCLLLCGCVCLWNGGVFMLGPARVRQWLPVRLGAVARWWAGPAAGTQVMMSTARNRCPLCRWWRDCVGCWWASWFKVWRLCGDKV